MANENVFSPLGASNHVSSAREKNDYYATDPRAIELLLDVEEFSKEIWEPACGEGHLSKVLEKHGYSVISTDLIYRGFGDPEPLDFLKECLEDFDGDIITNPPYKHAQEFVMRALDSVKDGHKVAMFLKIQFLEGKARRILFDNHPPKTIYVSTSRLSCAKNGDFESINNGAMCYAWYVWVKGYKGDTIVKWIN